MSNKPAECFVSILMDEGIKPLVRSRICDHLPGRSTDDGRKYCILHLPNLAKDQNFDDEVKKRLARSDYFFEGVYFPRPFSDLVSPKEISGMSFRFAKFAEGADFLDRKYTNRVDFSDAMFEKTVYFRSTFCKSVYFVGTEFQAKADFTHSEFQGSVHFNEAKFNGKAYFVYTKFGRGADFGSTNVGEKSVLRFSPSFVFGTLSFGSAVVNGGLHFEGGEAKIDADVDAPQVRLKIFEGTDARLRLSDMTVSRPEKIIFRNMSLRPNWFVDVDSRKFTLAGIEWNNTKGDLWNLAIKEELKKLTPPSRANGRLSAACRDLASNYEDKNYLRQASEFRYLALQSDRLRYRFHGWFWTIDWLYWLSSGYGEKRLRALAILASIIIAFSLILASNLATFDVVNAEQISELKSKAGSTPASNDLREPQFLVVRHLELIEAFVYSINVVSLQKPDPKPSDNFTRFLVALLTILGPVQFALLALAIRRKFIR